MAVTFDTLKKDATIFAELKKNPDWFERCKKDNLLYIEIRKDNQVNVYFEGGSIARVHYCSKHKELQVFTHYKYLGYEESDRTYIECGKTINGQLETILKNVKVKYSQKHADGGILPKEKWSEKYIQGALITNSRAHHLDSEFAYKDDSFDIRIDLVKVVDGEITFVELKRIDDNRMLKREEKKPEIVDQMDGYSRFISAYGNELLEYYQRLYDIKKDLGLPLPDSYPASIDPVPQLLIFNRWEKDHSSRTRHVNEMEKVLKNNSIKYSIINEL